MSSFDLINNTYFERQSNMGAGEAQLDIGARTVLQYLGCPRQEDGTRSCKATKKQPLGLEEELKTSMRPFGTESKTRAMTFLPASS